MLLKTNRQFRLAAIMLVRNEETILLDSIGHILRNLRVDRLFVIDNGSEDTTTDLLQRVSRIDKRVSWSSMPGRFEQDHLMTVLARTAFDEGSDWVLPVDADEFFDPGPEGFAPLETTRDVGAFSVKVRNFVQFRSMQAILTGWRPRRAIDGMVFSAEPFGDSIAARDLVESGAIPFVRATYPPKLVLRGCADISLARGCHSADGLPGPIDSLPRAEFLHAPVRNFNDLYRRVRHAERLAEMVSDPDFGWHLRRLQDMSADALRGEWRSNTTALGRIGGPGQGLRFDLRLRRIGRGLADFRAEVKAKHSISVSVPSTSLMASPPRRYDVEADWQLLNTCNYRCAYCFFPPATLGEKLRPAADPEGWERAFAATGLTWLLHLTGGEPTLYPGFAELCMRLSKRHFLSMNSNLTGPAVADFATRVDPSRVMFINAGLHHAERARVGGHAIFLRHARLLLDRGFPLFVSLVATPAVLSDPEAALKSVATLGLVPLPKLLQGTHEGRQFPDDYTDAERATFRRLAAMARAAQPRVASGQKEPPTIGLDEDEALLQGLPDFTGRDCAAGQRFLRLEGDGSAFRCSRKESLGNLLQGTLALRSGAAPCDTRYCFYFCRKYSAPAPLLSASKPDLSLA